MCHKGSFPPHLFAKCREPHLAAFYRISQSARLAHTRNQVDSSGIGISRTSQKLPVLTRGYTSLMLLRMLICAFAVLAAIVSRGFGQGASDLRVLFDAYKWNDLYGRVQNTSNAPLLYRGAMGVAFNQHPEESERCSYLLSAKILIHQKPTKVPSGSVISISTAASIAAWLESWSGAGPHFQTNKSARKSKRR